VKLRFLRRVLFAVLALLLAAPAVASADGGGGSSSSGFAPVTTGPNYDRNPSVVRDGRLTYLFFARSRVPCDRLAGCDADNTDYDLYVKVSSNGGRSYGPATLVAANPGPPALFRGRTIAATRRANGQMVVFWASGANANAPLYVLEETTQGSFSAPAPMPQFVPGVDGVFNVDAVSRGNDVFLYTEECCAAAGVYAYRYAGSAAATGRTLVSANKNLPKAFVDRNGVVRLTYTDASGYPTVEVYVDSSFDGLVFGRSRLAISEPGVSHWDPNLVYSDGLWLLFSAPDEGDGRQRIAVAVSRDFVRWTRPVRITPGSQGGVNYWDYWPEPFVGGADPQLYFTSERGIGNSPPGTGHIWVATLDD
jgi:hypothetical protein